MSLILAKIKREYNAVESSLSLIANQWAHAEDTRRIVAMESDGTTKRYYWDSTRLADQTGAYGAALIGALGITGVTPTGGSSGASGTVQAMLEGVASGPGGAVILAPAATNRNKIRSTGDFTALIIEKQTAQTNDVFRVQDTTGGALLAVQQNGNVQFNQSTALTTPLTVAISNIGTTTGAAGSSAILSLSAIFGSPSVKFSGGSSSFISAGIDNADSQKFKFSRSASLGTSDAMSIDTNGKILVGTNVDTAKPQFGVGGNIGFGDGAGTAWTSLTTSSATSFRFLPFQYWDGAAWSTQKLVCVQ